VSWKPTGEEMLAAIREKSAERRADPPKFVDEFLEMYAAEMSEIELDAKWEQLVNRYPWYADDLLYCIDAVLAAPGPVSTWACDMGQVEADSVEITRTITTEEWHTVGRRWLEDLRRRFVPVYERLTGGPRT
jgi:hypothetical protein